MTYREVIVCEVRRPFVIVGQLAFSMKTRTSTVYNTGDFSTHQEVCIRCCNVISNVQHGPSDGVSPNGSDTFIHKISVSQIHTIQHQFVHYFTSCMFKVGCVIQSGSMGRLVTFAGSRSRIVLRLFWFVSAQKPNKGTPHTTAHSWRICRKVKSLTLN